MITIFTSLPHSHHEIARGLVTAYPIPVCKTSPLSHIHLTLHNDPQPATIQKHLFIRRKLPLRIFLIDDLNELLACGFIIKV